MSNQLYRVRVRLPDGDTFQITPEFAPSIGDHIHWTSGKHDPEWTVTHHEGRVIRRTFEERETGIGTMVGAVEIRERNWFCVLDVEPVAALDR